MSLDVIQTLETELKECEVAIAAKTKRKGELTVAIAALKGNLPSAGGSKAPSGPTVPDMIEAAARSLDAEHRDASKPGACIFDNKKLVAKASAMFENHASRLKTGVYSAVLNLTDKKKILIRCPGGYQMAP